MSSRRVSTPPVAAEAEESLSPLARNSSSLSPEDRRTSDPRFGPIGGPSPTATAARDNATITAAAATTARVAPAATSNAPRALTGGIFRHVTRLQDLAPASTSTERVLRHNQPGRTYVTGLASWRRGSDQPSQRPAATERAAPSGPRTAEPDVPRPGQSAPLGNAGMAGRDGFNANATAYRAMDTRAPAFQARDMQPQRQQQPQQQQPRRPGGFDGLYQFRSRGPFQPMNMMLDPEASSRPLDADELRYRDQRGISHNYRGDSHNPSNESADIPDDQNCSVWITLLPEDCSYKDLLTAVAVHRPGQVWSTVISPPLKPKTYDDARLASTRHCAAKIVFYKPEAAQELIRVAGEFQFRVGDTYPRVIPNKIKVAPQPQTALFTSRVLWITGPPHIVNEANLTRLFRPYFRWDTEEVLVREEPRVSKDGVVKHTLEWRFGSYHCQAGAALHTLESYCPEATRCCAPDPCAQVLTEDDFVRLSN